MSFQRPLYQPGLCQLPYGDSRLTAERLPGIVLPQHTLQDKHGCFSLFYQKAIVSGVFCWNSSTQNLVAMHNYQQGWSLGLGRIKFMVTTKLGRCDNMHAINKCIAAAKCIDKCCMPKMTAGSLQLRSGETTKI
ncbi:hypothetical protein T02_10558 [Trichinella nativa]|uniref:Uncharacterized protein n=1 Tax=Trichinella nativa TaxID=6335 RepID=A0A0V1KNY0_9BILA|nr:hypothetical protein T02_10558 [Trichinella nativa]